MTLLPLCCTAPFPEILLCSQLVNEFALHILLGLGFVNWKQKSEVDDTVGYTSHTADQGGRDLSRMAIPWFEKVCMYVEWRLLRNNSGKLGIPNAGIMILKNQNIISYEFFNLSWVLTTAYCSFIPELLPPPLFP